MENKLEFENRLKDYIGNPYIVIFNNTKKAFEVAYEIIKKEKKESLTIICPVNCEIEKETVINADIDPNNGNIFMLSILDKLENNIIDAIQVKHNGGRPVDLNDLINIQKKYNNIPIIEDCTEAFGSEYNNKKLGNHNNICVFSMQIFNELSNNVCGILALPDNESYLFAKSKQLNVSYEITSHAMIYITHINEIINTMSRHAVYYYQNIKSNYVISMPYNKNKNLNFSYGIRVKFKDEFIHYMKSKNIEVKQTVHDSSSSVYPLYNIYNNQTVFLPVGWWLTSDEIKHIVHSINTFYVRFPLEYNNCVY
uniref:DegT/DnrJ/EryC1/StrS aminotransferase family protein n=1 Tax=viral metagenome TaxID=1070528 RepID=A0A6C0J7V1_9ZZZZ